MMNDIFAVEIAQGWLKIYLNDLLLCIEWTNRKELASRCLIILKKLKAHDLFIRPGKSEFFVTKTGFLGFIIDDG